MKLIYISCHEILEYQELRMFSQDLGIDCYSIGAYTQPGGDNHRKRPSLPTLAYEPHFIELALQHANGVLHPEMLDMLGDGDVVMFMHQPHLLRVNRGELLNAMRRGVRVIFRSIGQSGPEHEMALREAVLDGMEIVRYSPTESTIQGYAGANAMIRFYGDPNDYLQWHGTSRTVLNFTQSMQQRGDHTGWPAFQAATKGLPWVVYGPGNEGLGDHCGLLTYEQQLMAFASHRCYFYTGTYPASYTLSFIEAGMSGCPIIAVGPELGNGKHMYPWQECYEAHEILDLAGTVQWSDNLNMCNGLLKQLLNEPEMARAISAMQQLNFERVFGRESIAELWRSYLDA